jgi:hypothetical protein
MDVGRGVMAVWNDLESGHEAEFDAWYQRQHIPERLNQPGFREARRYLAQRGSPRYCAFYFVFIDASSEAAVGAAARRVHAAIGADQTQTPLRVSPCYQLTWQVSAAAAPAPCSDEEAGVTGSA